MFNIKKYIGKIALFIKCFIRECISDYYNFVANVEGGYISGNCTITNPQNIYVGNKSFINGGMILASKNAKIIIGQNCMISHNVHIRTDEHKYQDSNVFMHDQGMIEKDIIIGNDVWIGFGVQIMSGVTINDGVVIGAGSIVTSDCDSYSVYAGVPARKIKERK